MVFEAELNVWHRTSVAWGIFFLLTASFFLAIEHESSLVFSFSETLFMIGIVGTLFFVVIGFIFKKPVTRVVFFASILGIGLLAVVVCIFLVGTAAFYVRAIFEGHIGYSLIVGWSICSFAVLFNFYQYKKYIDHPNIEKRFFVMEPERIIFKHDKAHKISWEYDDKQQKSAIQSVWERYGYLMIPSALSGVVLYRLVEHASGTSGVLLMLSLLCLPLFFYALSGYLKGAYFYFFYMLQLERKYKKPVVWLES